MNGDVVAVIMAGGLGKRIGKNIPKVLLEVDGIPMIIRILLNLQELKLSHKYCQGHCSGWKNIKTK